MARMARIGISLPIEEARRFEALAYFEGKRPATLAAELVRAYMAPRTKDIETVLRAKAEYDCSVERLRKAHVEEAT